ncbi:hypothetical protein QJS66_18090 [Kocuria rhizophila]|nr:hypothetical protein QJS66_18090 [Kocuria rhizophila]
MVAPLVGGVIAAVADWRAFAVLAGLRGRWMLACSVLVIPETLLTSRARRGRGGADPAQRRAGGGGDRRLTLRPWGSPFASGRCTYISASSFVVQNVLGVGALGLSVVLARVNACGSIAAGILDTARGIPCAAPAARGSLQAGGINGEPGPASLLGVVAPRLSC